jgi:hypothetical protein
METNHGGTYQGTTASGNSRVIMGNIAGDVHMYGNDGRLLGVSQSHHSDECQLSVGKVGELE